MRGRTARPVFATQIRRPSSLMSERHVRMLRCGRTRRNRPPSAGSTKPSTRSSAGSNPGGNRAFRGSKADTGFDSVEWPKDGDGARWHPETNSVYLQGIGSVKVTAHRGVQGRVKTIQIRREGRRWILILSCDEVPDHPLPATGRQAGIDTGIGSFATTSDGRHFENPRWGRVAAEQLATAQQRLTRAKRGSKNRAGAGG